jgi:peptide/nickel transport system ATP-binding protein
LSFNPKKINNHIKNPVLHISNLSLSIGEGKQRKHILQGVDILLNKGELVALVGESGSGKSITSLTALQLLPNLGSLVDEGEIFYYKDQEEIALHKLSDHEMQSFRTKEIAMIFQEPMTALNPAITCGKQIFEAIHQHLNLSPSENKKRCINLFESVELPNPERIYKAYPHQLSGGQKQRVMIAMALSCDPKVLIADEPTTALDVTVQREVLDLIKRLQLKYKMACLFISHDLELVREVADSIIVMQNGKVVEKKTTKELFKNPEHSYTKALLACRPNLNKNLKRLATVSDFLENPNFDIHTFYTEKELSDEEVQHKQMDLYNGKPILEIIDLSKTYSDSGFFGNRNSINALKKVSLSLFKGESLGIVGESGCGKSTLGKCIVQLEKQSLGAILFKGTSVGHILENDILTYRKSVQMIFQDPASALNPKMKIGAILTEVMAVHKIGVSSADRKKRAEDLLVKVGLLPEHFNRYPHEFSGGQKQRIGIARALALEPEVIICDESVSALDVSVQAQVLNLLNDLKDSFGLSYIFISHDLSVVKHFCDRIIVLNKGEVEEEGFPDELFENPKTDYTKSLIESIPGIRE